MDNADRRVLVQGGVNISTSILRILVGALIVVLAVPASAESPRDEIEAALVTFETAFNSGDATAVAALPGHLERQPADGAVGAFTANAVCHQPSWFDDHRS